MKPVYEEMNVLSNEGSPKLRGIASSALNLCRDKCRILQFESMEGETVDEMLMKTAQSLECLVATNDRDLRLKLRKKGIPVVYLRQRAFLKLDGWT